MNNDTPADAITPLKSDLVEAFDMAHALIQEAKPREGYITDHLDAAENWLDTAQEIALAAMNTRPSLAAQDGLVEALRFYAEEDRYDYDQTCCTYAATKKRRRELEKSGGWVLEDGGEKARAALASIEVKS